MESEEKSEESPYPSPMVPEITNIQKRLQKICGVDDEEAKVRDWFKTNINGLYLFTGKKKFLALGNH